ncbi:hypothetical protein Leryth_010607 [Lithospermum erythrorhizon]|nr:hypothetical protein Leryth_010607 [Lithospermum erythrorhizon]
MLNFCPYLIITCEAGKIILGRKPATPASKYDGENASRLNSVGKRTPLNWVLYHLEKAWVEEY